MRVTGVMAWIGAATGVIALLWNVVSFLWTRLRRVEVKSACGAWYVVTGDPTPRTWVHCVVRFANTGSLPASIIDTRLTLAIGDQEPKEFDVVEPSGQRIEYPNPRNPDATTITMQVSAKQAHLAHNSDVVLVDPSAPVDREVWAVVTGSFDHRFEEGALRVECTDNRGRRSSCETPISYIPGEPTKEHP